MRVEILQEGDQLEVGEPRGVFSTVGAESNTTVPMWDIHPDGGRFLAITPDGVEEPSDEADQAGIGPVVVVTNWFGELERRLGEDGGGSNQ